MSERQTCGARLQSRGRWDSFHLRTCGKPSVAVIDGKPLCSLHKKVADRRKAKAEKYDRDWVANENWRKHLQALSEAHRISLQPYHSPHSPGVAIDQRLVLIATDDLMRLLGDT